MMCNSSTNWGTCLSQPCYTAREYANVALQWIESTPSWLWIGSPDQYPGFHIEIASNFWQLSPPKIWENYWVESLGPIPSFGWFKKVFPPHGSQLLSSLYIYRNVKLQYCTVFISILLYIFQKNMVHVLTRQYNLYNDLPIGILGHCSLVVSAFNPSILTCSYKETLLAVRYFCTSASQSKCDSPPASVEAEGYVWVL